MTDNLLTRTEIAYFAQCLAHTFNLRLVMLFGSYATGKARSDSDVDFIVSRSDGLQLTNEQYFEIEQFASKYLHKNVHVTDLEYLRLTEKEEETRRFLTQVKQEALRYV